MSNGAGGRVAGLISVVEADDGVKMDDPAALVLDDLGEAHPDMGGQSGGGDAGGSGEAAAGGDGGAPPQLAGQGVPDHGGAVVETVRADRRAHLGVVRVVDEVAGPGLAVGADTGGLGPARAGLACRGVAGGVNRAEAGGGERGEHGGVVGDRLGDALAAA